MWSAIKLKTKIAKRHWITCHCNQCVKEKWSRYQKKTSKTIKLVAINALIWFVAVDGIYGWHQERFAMTFTNVTNSLVSAGALVGEEPLQSTSIEERNRAHPEGGVVETKNEGGAGSPVAPQVEVIEKIKKAFPGEENVAVAIAKCESQLDPSRIGDLHMKYPSIGLFQINQTWHKYDTKTLQNPDENIRIAKEIKDRWGNWNAWSCWKFGYYTKYLNS